MSGLRVSLLGPVEVAVEGRPIPLVGRKRLAVVAVLALRAGRVVSADALIDALWELHPPASAPNTLQSHVSHVRRALGPAAARLVSRPPGYRLDVPADGVDVHRFEALAAAGRAALAAQRPAEAVDSLAAALRLWRGPALGDLAGLEFADREATRLEEARLTVVEDRAEAELALGRSRQVAAGLGELLAHHPRRERLAGQLMLALYRSDRQAEALQVFQHTRRRLIEELGIEPGRALQALEEAILLQKPELDLGVDDPTSTGLPPPPGGVATGDAVPAGATGPSPHPPAGTGTEGAADADPAAAAVAGVLPGPIERIRGRGACVGRDELVEAVTQRVGSAPAPFVLLTGEPGIGKSRLAAEIAHRVSAAGELVVYGRCDPDGGAPYHPIVDALAELAERDPSPGTTPGGRAATTPVELVLEPAVTGGDPGPAARRQAFDRVADALHDAGGGRRVLVVLDDLHWVDRATAALLRHLVLGPAAGRFGLVATCRSTAGRSPWLAALLEQATADEALIPVDVDALTVAAVAELASALGLDDEPAALHSATGGNPLLIRQLRHRAVDATGGDRRWGSLALLLEQRVAALSDQARSLLEVAAVAGTSFDLAVVAGAAGLAGPDALHRLDEAREARLIDDRDGDGPSRFAFVHDVVREFLAEQVPSSRRLHLHAALAGALDQAGAEASIIAHHHLAAAPALGNRIAADRVAAAADRARQRLAYEDAAALYRVAAELLARDPVAGRDRREEIVLALATAYFDAGDPAAARGVVMEVADAARRRGDAVRLAEAAIAYQGRWIPTAVGRDDDHRVLLTDARSLLGQDGPAALRARLDARLALAGFHRGGDEPEYTSRAAAAVQEATASGNPRALAEALTARHTTAVLHLAPQQRLRLCAELRTAALRSGDAETVANSHAAAAIDRLAAGDVAGARGELVRFDRHATATGSATLRWRQEVLATTFALADGRFDDAEEASARAFELGTELNQDDAGFAWAAQTFVSTWLRRGAGSVVDAAGDLAERHPEVPAWRTTHTLALADDGRLEQAVAQLELLMADGLTGIPRDLLWVSAMVTASEAVVRCGHRPSVPGLIERLEPYTGTLAVVGAGVAVLGPVDRILGLLHAIDDRTVDAERHLERALEVLGPHELAPFRALTLLARAEVRARTGANASPVADDAAEARRIALDLGMGPVARRAADVVLRRAPS